MEEREWGPVHPGYDFLALVDADARLWKPKESDFLMQHGDVPGELGVAFVFDFYYFNVYYIKRHLQSRSIDSIGAMQRGQEEK